MCDTCSKLTSVAYIRVRVHVHGHCVHVLNMDLCGTCIFTEIDMYMQISPVLENNFTMYFNSYFKKCVRQGPNGPTLSMRSHV